MYCCQFALFPLTWASTWSHTEVEWMNVVMIWWDSTQQQAYRAAVRTVLLYVPSCCTYRAAVRTVLLYVPSCCTYRLAVRTVLLYVPCCCTYSSTVQRQVRLNPLQHKCYVMYRQFNSQQFYVLPTQCIGVFRINLRTNSSYFTVQH